MLARSPRAIFWLCAVFLLAGCAVTRPTVKIGLVAPFEGRYRQVGYEVIFAVRLAVREANAAGGVAGHTVELVALDDQGDPARAIEQAHKLSLDPQVYVVLGHWLTATTEAAAPEYARLGLPLLLPPASAPALATTQAESYRALSFGLEPGPIAARAYALTQQALAELAQRLTP